MESNKDMYSEHRSQRSKRTKKSEKSDRRRLALLEEEEKKPPKTDITLIEKGIENLKNYLDHKISQDVYKNICFELNLQKNVITNINFLPSYRSIDGEEGSGYFVRLKKLNVSSNLLTNVELNFPNLLYLNLSENYLEKIPELSE